MRASRLMELLLLLQVRRAATASELADTLGVSVRTVLRDVTALQEAGVAVYTETGRAGGIRLAGEYRLGGEAPVDPAEAQRLALAVVPGAARDLGIGGSRSRVADAALAPLRDRLLIEPEPWFGEATAAPFLTVLASAVWAGHEVRIGYSGRRGVTDSVIRPLGLILKAGTWYVLARTRTGVADRLYRLSRVVEAAVLPHRFERPEAFDLEAAWARRKVDFAASIPTYPVAVRLAAEGERLLGLLQEGTPRLPLPDDVERDRSGWALLTLRFERPASAARLLLQLGAEVEVIDPPELRELMAATADDLRQLYRRRRRPPQKPRTLD